MKKILLHFILCAALIFALCSCVMAASAPDGFRGIKWGTPLSKLNDMIYNDSISDRLKMYTRIGDKMFVGNVKLEGVFYNFLDGKFSGVILVPQYSMKDDINAMLRKRYGNPQQVATDTYTWVLGSGAYPFMITAEPMDAGFTQIYRVRYFTPQELEHMLNLLGSGADEL